LATLARGRNAPDKHVWRAEIVLLSAYGVGTNEIMRRTGKSKTCVWRWQGCFMQAGCDGLPHNLVERVVMVTLRVPYPLGFYAKRFDGRVDDPNAGWKAEDCGPRAAIESLG